LKNLTRAAMIEFNQGTPDAVGEVKYFYHAGIVQPESLTPVFYLPSVVVSSLEDTANDGWISFASANRHGSAMRISADHLQQIGHGISGFDHLNFYTEIVKKVTGKNCTPP